MSNTDSKQDEALSPYWEFDADGNAPKPTLRECPLCPDGGQPYFTRTVNGTNMIYVGCSQCGLELKAALMMVTPTQEQPSKDILAIWNTRSRASVAAVEGDAIHWQLAAGVAETMCGVSVESEQGIQVTLLSDKATCRACDAAAWGYKCGRADERAAASSSLPASPTPQSHGIQVIAAERQRHFDVEGWTLEHDDEHVDESLAQAAACYAWPRMRPLFVKQAWPWQPHEWKPEIYGVPGATDSEKRQARIRVLAKAGALIAAEIDRLERIK